MTLHSKLPWAFILTAAILSGADKDPIKPVSKPATPPEAINEASPGPFTLSTGSTIFSPTATPANVWNNDPNPITVGVKFRADSAGTISGIRFYKGAGNNGTHIGLLYTSTGTVLGQATFSGESASGWQQVDFATPITISANTTYLAAMFTTSGYAYDSYYFSSTGVDNPPLHALRSGVDGPNGVYTYGASPQFPTTSLETNYWVDVVFAATPPPASSYAIWPSTTTPANTWNNDPNPITVGVKFRSDSAGTVNAIRFYKGTGNNGTHTGLLYSSTGALLAQITFSGESASGWQEMSLTTPIAIAANTTYVAALFTNSGYAYNSNYFASTGVDNPPLHALRSGVDGSNGLYAYGASPQFPATSLDTNYWVDVVVSISGPPPPPPPPPALTIWPGTATPGLAWNNETNPITVGVKFRSDVAGTVNGIRFYKGTGNTGNHVGVLYSSTGTVLAQANFSGETASGWQQVNFSAPVSISAGTTYVAALYSNSGFAFDEFFFTSAGVDNAPLHALRSGVDGGNGLYIYDPSPQFPVYTYFDSNYWVDVSFSTNAPPPPSTPTPTQVSPNLGSGSSQIFTATYGDAAGYADITDAQILVQATATPASACNARYSNNALYLRNDGDTAWLGPLTLPSSGELKNTQCILSGAWSSRTGVDTTLTVSFALSFRAGYTGAKNIYLRAANATTDSGWLDKGDWTPVPVAQPPENVSANPSGNIGSTQTFDFTSRSVNGYEYIDEMQVLFNYDKYAGGACYLTYNRASNVLSIFNDDGEGVKDSDVLGTNRTIENSQCAVTLTTAQATGSFNDLTLRLPITFKSGLPGPQNIYLYTKDAGNLVADLQQVGTWTSTTVSSQGPAAVSVLPASGQDWGATFIYKASSANGSSYIVEMSANIDNGNAPVTQQSCYVSYYPKAYYSLVLLDDSGSPTKRGRLAIAGEPPLSNSHCTIDVAGSTANGVGNDLTLSLVVAFDRAWTGQKNNYLYVNDRGNHNTGWQSKGTWTVGAPPISVSLDRSNTALLPNETLSLNATVTGTPNTAVNWEISSTLGGTFNPVGNAATYQAPSTISSQQTLTITARSAADSTRFAAITVTLSPPPAGISVSLDLHAVTLAPGETRNFTATVTGTGNTAVTWDISTTYGTFTRSANVATYQSPSSLASQQTVTITATSAADTTKSDVATLTLSRGLASGRTCSINIACTVSPFGNTGWPTAPFVSAIANLSSSQRLTITPAGTVNLDARDFTTFLFNPDGSLNNPTTAESWQRPNYNYNYAKPGSTDYPNAAGGDRINHFIGGGMNYDAYSTPPQTPWGIYFNFPQSTDTANRQDLVRFGSLVGSLDNGLSWFFIGNGKTIGPNSSLLIPEGATLYLAVYSSNYAPEAAGVETGSYTVLVAPALPQVTAPTFDPPGDTYPAGQMVAIASATPGAVIHYTSDGTTPTQSSPTYQDRVPVNVTTVLKAIASKDSMSDSTVTSGTYTIPVTITVSPASIMLTANQVQTLTADVGNTSNTAVNWSIAPANIGTFTPNGNAATYQAPSSITAQQSFTITAISAADPTKSKTVTVTLIPPPPIGSVCSSVVPAAGVVCTVNPFANDGTPAQPFVTAVTNLSSAQTIRITATGSVRLNPSISAFWFNPDGTLTNPGTTDSFGTYNFAKPGASGYPTVAGGNGTNSFSGGGFNYDPYAVSPQTPWGFYFNFPKDTDTTDTSLGLVRFGSLVGSVDGGARWFYIGTEKLIGAGTPVAIPNNGNLYLAVYNSKYSPLSADMQAGSFQVTVAPPTAISISPITVAMPAGTLQTFQATVNGSTTTSVTWAIGKVVNGQFQEVPSGNSCGSFWISNVGPTVTYQAPSSEFSCTFDVSHVANPYIRATYNGITSDPSQVIVQPMGLNPYSANFAGVGGSSHFDVTASGIWTATVQSQCSWIRINIGGNESDSQSGFNNGRVEFIVHPNGNAIARSCSIVMNPGSAFTVNQAAGVSIMLNPSITTVPSPASYETITVTATGSWSVSVDSGSTSWITVVSPAGLVNGNGTVILSLSANSGVERVGTIHVGGVPLVITQRSVSDSGSLDANLTLSTNSTTFRIAEFTFSYDSATAKLQDLYVLVNGEQSDRNACSFRVRFTPPTPDTPAKYQYFLKDDSGTMELSPVGLSEPTLNVENSQCRITVAKQSNAAAEPYTPLAVTLGVLFKNESFMGHKTIWMRSVDATSHKTPTVDPPPVPPAEAWKAVGRYCIGNPQTQNEADCYDNNPPYVGEASPPRTCEPGLGTCISGSSATDQAVPPTFTFTVWDDDGWEDITKITVNADGPGNCDFEFHPITQTLTLTGVGTIDLWNNPLRTTPLPTIENTTCRVGGPSTSFAGTPGPRAPRDASQNIIPGAKAIDSWKTTLRIPIQFKQPADSSNPYRFSVKVQDAAGAVAPSAPGVDSVSVGTWTVTGGASQDSPPTVVENSVKMVNAAGAGIHSGTDANLQLSVRNTNGANEISWVQVYIRDTPKAGDPPLANQPPPASSCVILVDAFSRRATLLDDFGMADGAYPTGLGMFGMYTNHQCRIHLSTMDIGVNKTDPTILDISIPVSIQETYADRKDVYVRVLNSSGLTNSDTEIQTSQWYFTVSPVLRATPITDRTTGPTYLYWTRDIGQSYNPQGLKLCDPDVNRQLNRDACQNVFLDWSQFSPLKWYLNPTYRTYIDAELRQMRANGANTIELSVDFGRYDKSDDNAKPLPSKDCLGETDLPPNQNPFFIYPQSLAAEYPNQGFSGQDWRLLGHLLPSGADDSGNLLRPGQGRMTQNCKLSLTRFVQTLKSLEFKELFIDTAPTGGNKDTGVAGNAPGSFPDFWLPSPSVGSVSTIDCWTGPGWTLLGYPSDEQLLNQAPSTPPSAVDYFNENYGFMKDLMSTLVDTQFPFKLDLGGEMVPSPITTNPVTQQLEGETSKAYYVQVFWRRLLLDQDTKIRQALPSIVGFSFAVPPEVDGYIAQLPCWYGGTLPAGISYHLGDNAYNILIKIQNAIRQLPPRNQSPQFWDLHQINAETQYNDPLTANSLNQALLDLGPNAIPIDYLTQWFFNAFPPGDGPSATVPEDPRPANVDSSEFRDGPNHNKFNKCW